MAKIMNLDILKKDLDVLVIRILKVSENTREMYADSMYAEKLVLASELESIIKKHFNTEAPKHMTNKEAADIAVNGYKGK